MAKHKRRKAQKAQLPNGAEIAERKQIALDMYVTGRPQHEIAAKLGVDGGTVSRYVEGFRLDWKLRHEQTWDQHAQDELARIDHLERVAWEGWLRSCQDAETLLAESTKGAEDERTKTSKRIEGQSGDRGFLSEVRACIELRMKLLGLVVERVKHEHKVVVIEDDNWYGNAAHDKAHLVAKGAAPSVASPD